MDKITTIADAKKAGRELAEQLQAEDNHLNFEFKELADTLSQAGLEDVDTTALAALLAMPDDQFKILAPIFLDELERSYNNTNNSLLLLRTFNSLGKTVEEVREEYEMVLDDINDLANNISTAKVDFLKRLMGLFYNSIADIDGIEKFVIEVPMEYCRENAKMPEYAHLTDSGMDVFATEDIDILPGETKLIPIGIKCALPRGYELQVRPKSGRSLKSKLRVANAPGTIDAGYRDEIGIIVDNIDPVIRSAEIDENGRLYNVVFGSTIHIEKGEKIAQLVLARVPKVHWVEVETLMGDLDDRGGGFGSTGLK